MRKISLNGEGKQRLNALLKRICEGFSVPEGLTVSEWADKYRVLSLENSAEAGKWRTSRVPYMKEIMDSFSDDDIKSITIVASSQVGKTEVESNMTGYVMDQDPGPALFVMPTKENVEDFARRRLEPMIRDTECLRRKVGARKSRDGGNTILRKLFPGGSITLFGTNVPGDLASIPARYIFGDEVDRWTRSAGTEGDPWGLLEARTTTFYNAKMVAVSTPTIRGNSKIADLFDLGTREFWETECPECGEYSFIRFQNIRFEHVDTPAGAKMQFSVSNVRWACPCCGAEIPEAEAKRLPQKWIAENPDARSRGRRSFWINGFASPWLSWEKICLRYLEADYDSIESKKVVYNTLLGELWEERGDVPDERALAERAEPYEAELPDGVLVLTMGVDTQDNRLEYEVVGHGFFREKWGIEKGFIMGRPDSAEVWEKLDAVRKKQWMFANGRTLRISATLVDAGGHFTSWVYYNCSMRSQGNMYAIHGDNQMGVGYTSPPRPMKYDAVTKDGKHLIGKGWYYRIGTDAGKSEIMGSLKVEAPGPNYSHFPQGRGYDSYFYTGLLSEALVPNPKTGKMAWKLIIGHKRNEALDCRNYANAAFELLHADLDSIKRKLEGVVKDPQSAKPRKRVTRSRTSSSGGDW